MILTLGRRGGADREGGAPEGKKAVDEEVLALQNRRRGRRHRGHVLDKLGVVGVADLRGF